MGRILYFISVVLLLNTACQDQNASVTPPGLNVDELINLAETLKRSNTDSAFVLAKNLYEYSRSVDSQNGIASSSLFLGELLYEMGNISQANDFLNEAQANFRSTGNESQVAQTNILLSRIYQRSENYHEAFSYLNEARQTYQRSNDLLGLANVYADIGHIHEKLQQYDSALFYQGLALESFTQVQDTSGLAMIYDNIGSIHEDLEQFNEAYTNFQKGYSLNKTIGATGNAIINLNNLGDVHRKTGHLDSAVVYTRMALDLAQKHNHDYQVKSAYRDLSKLHSAKGNTDSAYHFLEKSYELTDELFSRQIAQEIARSQTIYDLQQKQQRIAFLEKSESTNRKLAILGLTGAFSLILFGGIIFRQQRQKNRKSRQLLEAEAELTRIELENAHLSEQNLKTELENKQLREEQLKHELELKSKSLTKSTLHMVQKNEFLHMMRSKLKRLNKTEDPEVKKVIKRLIRSIDFNSNVDDDWKEFETVFAQVHSSFYESLKQEYKELFPIEVWLCAMIRLYLHFRDLHYSCTTIEHYYIHLRD
jgi:tetratricopeptide (TPR) repeat protein